MGFRSETEASPSFIRALLANAASFDEAGPGVTGVMGRLLASDGGNRCFDSSVFSIKFCPEDDGSGLVGVGSE